MDEEVWGYRAYPLVLSTYPFILGIGQQDEGTGEEDADQGRMK